MAPWSQGRRGEEVMDTAFMRWDPLRDLMEIQERINRVCDVGIRSSPSTVGLILIRTQSFLFQ